MKLRIVIKLWMNFLIPNLILKKKENENFYNFFQILCLTVM